MKKKTSTAAATQKVMQSESEYGMFVKKVVRPEVPGPQFPIGMKDETVNCLGNVNRVTAETITAYLRISNGASSACQRRLVSGPARPSSTLK